MQTISGSVGEGAANARHDVALVQVMLVVSRRPPSLDPVRRAYLSRCDGVCGSRTIEAIRQFQFDNVFVSARGMASQTVPGVQPARIYPQDPTWQKLVAFVTAARPELGDLYVLENSATVYIGASRAQLNTSITRVAQMTFENQFLAKLLALTRRVYERRHIAISVCPQGDRRTFQQQTAEFLKVPRVTGAGPGESNHNFGQAVDLGFHGLHWLQPDGAVKENEDWWLHQLDSRQGGTKESKLFWDMLRSEGMQSGLFCGPPADRPHLQAWNDATVNMAKRLAVLLTQVGRIRWEGRLVGGHRQYECDLGFGGALFQVGSAFKVWDNAATINEAVLTQARAQPTAPQAVRGTKATAPLMSASCGQRYGPSSN